MSNITNDRIKKIGQIIEKERKTKKWKSADDLADKLNTTRQTVRNWERGEKSPTLHDFVRMCELFDCDFGYLVGEYACKTRRSTDIQKETGLSENAIKVLDVMKIIGDDMVLWFNQLIESAEFMNMLWSILFADEAYTCRFNRQNKQEKHLLQDNGVPDSIIIDSMADEQDAIVNELNRIANKSTTHTSIRREYACSFYIQEAQNHLRKAIEEILERRNEANAPQK